MNIAASFLVVLLALAQTPQEKLDASLRLLEKEIAAVRGLEFKTPVQARIIPRQAGDAKEKQGYYDPRAKSLFLYDDLANNYQKGVLIHEMVHALQDQHFDLTRLKAKLHQDKFGSDAELALAALIEGDATFTMIEVLKKEQPKAAAMLGAPLEKAKNLQNAFLYAQGARYIKSLKDKGGWAGVNAAYRFPPRSTAPILNLSSVSSIDLGRGESRGAYALLAQLVKNTETRAGAVALAQGWRGDRTHSGPLGTAHVYASKDADNARKLGDAMLAIHQAAKPWKPAAGHQHWEDGSGNLLAIVAKGPRLFVFESSSADSLAKLRDKHEGPLHLEIREGKTKAAMPFGVMIEKLLVADIVCIGESHDSELCHRVQLQIIKGLYAQDERLGVGMEMFQRPYQKALDRYVNKETSETEFLKESDYGSRWGFDWSLYRPIIQFCHNNGLPMAALNASRELTKRISAVGIAALKDEEKKELGEIDLHVKEHRDYWYERLAKMHGPSPTKTSEAQKEHGYQVMTVWDDFMARSAADFLKERGLRRLVVLAGSGHIDRGFGIPDRAARYSGRRSLTVGIVIEGTSQKQGEAVTDFVVVVK